MAEFINLFISPLRIDTISQINNQFCNHNVSIVVLQRKETQ